MRAKPPVVSTDSSAVIRCWALASRPPTASESSIRPAQARQAQARQAQARQAPRRRTDERAIATARQIPETAVWAGLRNTGDTLPQGTPTRHDARRAEPNGGILRGG